MCTGIELALAAMTAASAGSALMGDKPSYAPPTPDPGAMKATASRAAGATVRVGGDNKKTTDALVPDYEGFVEKRVSGKSLGGLGRGGLGL